MKLRVRDTEYDYQAALNESDLGTYRDLKRVTGFGRRSLQEALAKLNDITLVDDIFEDEALLTALIALAWLCLHHAGKPVPLAECEALQLNDLEFITEPGDVVDPPQASQEEAAAAAGNDKPNKPAAKPSTGTSKTSRPRSTSTS